MQTQGHSGPLMLRCGLTLHPATFSGNIPSDRFVKRCFIFRARTCLICPGSSKKDRDAIIRARLFYADAWAYK